MTEPVGEDAWLALVDEASRTAGNIEQRIEVVELYKRAVAAEPWSNKLWLAYCEWVWSLHTDCQNGDAGWPEEEQLLGQELFSLEVGIDMWQQGAQATQYRLNDSHELWNRWMSIEIQLLSEKQTKAATDRIKNLYLQRLQIPHATWSETSSALSSFLSRFDEKAYEQTMVEGTKLLQPAKDLYEQREAFEVELKTVVASGDKEAIKITMAGYLDWESEPRFIKQAGGKPGSKKQKLAPPSPPILRVALYERALCSTPLGREAAVWEDYIVYISSDRLDAAQVSLPPVLSIIQRATSHCPWSGALWARYILCAEAQELPFETMEQIKHTATDNRELDRDGIGGVVEFYAAWVGFLKRRTQISDATDDDADIAEMGLLTALESVHEWGQRRHGKKDFKGDPLFRIERIYIQHLTHQVRYEEARAQWKKLVGRHGDGYDFWTQYYLWEMSIRPPAAPPTDATAVLIQAVERKGLDWPEKMMEIYVRHCNNYDNVNALLKAMSTVHIATKSIAKRREREAKEAAAYYAQQQPQAINGGAVDTETTSSASKRKREDEPGQDDESASKKAKNAADYETNRAQELKRDRENTSVIVSNLPPEITQTKVRQYFREYGHINNMTLKVEADKASAAALIDFRSPEDVQSALLRDAKYLGDRQIKVEPGTGLTLYVTNYPPAWGDAELRKLFKDCGEIFNIRWPSLKYNAHRRFCYVSFRTPEAAAAATDLHGHSLGGVYKLSAQYSDPGNKKVREGAMAEGREVHVTGVDSALSETDLHEVFEKYGTVERTRILRNAAGESKGAAFISFEKKEEATAALELDKTKLKSRVLTVEMSTGKNFKPTATVLGKGTSMSPGPDGDGDSMMSRSPGPDGSKLSRQDHINRTITLMNVPDTFNVARIRALAESHGEISKVTLRPDHQGAIIEYSDAASAGTAAMKLEGYEIEPGRKLRTGGMKDLLSQKEEVRSDYMAKGPVAKKAAPALMPAPAIKRPVGPGGRGGLGQKRGLGFSAAKATAPVANDTTNTQINGNGDVGKKQKSNADFKALFVSGGTQ